LFFSVSQEHNAIDFHQSVLGCDVTSLGNSFPLFRRTQCLHLQGSKGYMCVEVRNQLHIGAESYPRRTQYWNIVSLSTKVWCNYLLIHLVLDKVLHGVGFHTNRKFVANRVTVTYSNKILYRRDS
jgi:hypothetical protein